MPGLEPKYTTLMFTVLETEISIRRVRFMLCAVLACAACFNAWHLIETLGENSQTHPDYSSVSDPTAPVVSAQQSAEHLAERHLFGTTSETDVKDAPVSFTSSVRVIGILTSDTGDNGWAILEAGGAQRAYSVGSKLPSGETLIAIDSDHVILDKDGNRYSVLWEMQQADSHARFRTLTLTTDNLTAPSLMPGSTPAVETQRMLQELREKLLAKKRLSFSAQPPSPSDANGP